MKRYILPAVILLAFYWPISCTNNEGSTTATDSLNIGTTTADASMASASASSHSPVETETYTDLKTGKTFRIKRDNSGNYTSESGEPLDYYYSETTRDTFYGPSGRWVNNALIYDPDNGYSIDESRASQSAAMDADKVKANENEFKAKSNDGEDKVKLNENEAKMKSSDGSKIKVNEDEVKIKTSDGSKIKANEDETKIKSKSH
jgi:hypothetical protein